MTIFLTSRGRSRLLAGLIAAVCLERTSRVFAVPVAADSLPASLTDQEFWKLIARLLRAERLLPLRQPAVERDLASSTSSRSCCSRRSRAASTWASAPSRTSPTSPRTKPAMVFIVDVRRGNLDLQLMYKALFELSADRADFVSRLFSKKRPDGLDRDVDGRPRSSARSANVETNEALYKENLKAIDDQLVKKHGFALVADDLAGHRVRLPRVLSVRPAIQYSSTRRLRRTRRSRPTPT